MKSNFYTMSRLLIYIAVSFSFLESSASQTNNCPHSEGKLVSSSLTTTNIIKLLILKPNNLNF